MIASVAPARAIRPHSLAEIGTSGGTNLLDKIDYLAFKRGQEIFAQGQAAEYVYQVEDGAGRTHKLLLDGRRQIGAFHLADDIFGLGNGAIHRFTAEAIIGTSVRRVRRDILEGVVGTEAIITRTLLSLTTSNLQHVENHMLLLGRKNSMERVAAFLLEMDAPVLTGN